MSYPSVGGGGASFAIGPTPNEFRGATRAIALAALAAQSLQTAWLDVYDAAPMTGSDNAPLNVRLFFTADSIQYMELLARDNGSWVVNASFQGIVGEQGVAGIGEKSSFNSIAEMDNYYATGARYTTLKTGDNNAVTINGAVFQYEWSGIDAPESYDPALFRLAEIGTTAGSLIMGPTSIESGAEVLMFKSATGGQHYIVQSFFDSTGSQVPMYYDAGPIYNFDLALVDTDDLPLPLDFETIFPDTNIFTTYTIKPSLKGTLHFDTYLGTKASHDEFPILSETIGITLGQVGTEITINMKNPAVINSGQQLYTELSGDCRLFGGLQTVEPEIGQITMFAKLGMQNVDKYNMALVADFFDDAVNPGLTKVSTGDTNLGGLFDKIKPGVNVTTFIDDSGANEKLLISATGGGLEGAQIHVQNDTLDVDYNITDTNTQLIQSVYLPDGTAQRPTYSDKIIFLEDQNGTGPDFAQSATGGTGSWEFTPTEDLVLDHAIIYPSSQPDDWFGYGLEINEKGKILTFCSIMATPEAWAGFVDKQPMELTIVTQSPVAGIPILKAGVTYVVGTTQFTFCYYPTPYIGGDLLWYVELYGTKLDAGNTYAVALLNDIPVLDGNDRVSISASDTEPAFLDTKLIAGDGLTATISATPDEVMTIDIDGKGKVKAAGSLDFLANQIVAGANITVTSTDSDITIALADGTHDNNRVSVNALDTTPNYLEDKIVGGTNVTIAEQGTGATKSLLVDVPDADLAGVQDATKYVISNTMGTGVTINKVTSSIAGLMIPSDSDKLDTIAPNAEVNVPSDLAYTPGTRLVSNTNGTGFEIPLASATVDGLITSSGFDNLEKVAIDVSDAAPGYLFDKITGGGGVTIVKDGGTVKISSDATGDLTGVAIDGSKGQLVATYTDGSKTEIPQSDIDPVDGKAGRPYYIQAAGGSDLSEIFNADTESFVKIERTDPTTYETSFTANEIGTLVEVAVIVKPGTFASDQRFKFSLFDSADTLIGTDDVWLAVGRTGLTFSQGAVTLTPGDVYTLEVLDISFVSEGGNTFVFGTDTLNLTPTFTLDVTTKIVVQVQNLALEENVNPDGALTYQDGFAPIQLVEKDLVSTSLGKGKYKFEVGANIQTVSSQSRGFVAITVWLDGVEAFVSSDGASSISTGDNYGQISGVFYYENTTETPVVVLVSVTTTSVTNTKTRSMYSYITKI